MPKRLLWLCLLLSGSLLAAPEEFAAVDESEIEIRWESERALVRINVVNPSLQEVAGRLDLAIVDEKEARLASVSLEVKLGPGRNPLEAAIPYRIAEVPHSSLQPLLSGRLQWRLSSSDSSRSESGLVSLLRASPGLFAIWVETPWQVAPGDDFPIHLSAANPIRGDAAAGARAEARLDQGSTTLQRVSVDLDAEGFATLILKAPKDPFSQNLQLAVDIRLGGYTRRFESSIEIANPARIALGLDKPLHQPGETLKIRMLAHQNGRLLSDRPARVIVRRDDGTQAFAASLTTSKFGVAETQWRIPEEEGPASYFVIANLETHPEAQPVAAGRTAQVRRYELPGFAVETETDRPYYRPEDKPKLRVRSAYLSGRELTEGEVRITRSPTASEESTASELEVARGRLKDGLFEAELDLAAARLEFAEQDFLQATAIGLTAWVSDDSTKRTERRDFQIRVARGGILLQLIDDQNSPSGFFVAASHPDGTPAPCEIRLKRSREDPDSAALGVFRTNRYGVAWIEGLGSRESPLHVTARDADGRTGYFTTEYLSEPTTEASLLTDRALYRAGEDIVVDLAVEDPPARGFVEVYRNESILHTQRVVVDEKGVRIAIPYREDFSGLIKISFISPDLDSTPERTVLFPRRDEVELETHLAGGQFRPGQTVDASFRLREPNGEPAPGVLGLVVFDRAVQDRFRSDAGSRGSAASAFLPYPNIGPGLGGTSLHDLSQLELNEPPPPDLDLLAQALLRSYEGYGYRPGHTDTAVADPLWFADSPLGLRLAQIRKEYLGVAGATRFRQGDTTLQDWLAAQTESLLDPWGNPFEARLTTDWTSLLIKLVSAGPDEALHTADDVAFLSERVRWFYGRDRVILSFLRDYQRRYGDSVHDAETLRRLLRNEGLTDEDWVDPWGNPLQIEFTFRDNLETLEIRSDGPPALRKPETLLVSAFQWPYFTPRGRELDQALDRVRQRTGEVIADIDALAVELRREGFDLHQVRDHWGRICQPRIRIDKTLVKLDLVSPGDDQRFSEQPSFSSDDFTLWESVVGDTFQSQREELLKALEETTKPPSVIKTLKDLETALRQSGIDLEDYFDYWGHPMRAQLESETIQVWRTEVQEAGVSRSFRAYVQDWVHLRLFSAGPDGRIETADDFAALTFTFSSAEAPDPADPRPPDWLASKLAALAPDAGGVAGTARDASGGVLPGLLVNVLAPNGDLLAQSLTDEGGGFALMGLAPGPCRIVFRLAGFRTLEIASTVAPGRVPVVTAVLEIGAFESLAVASESSGTQYDLEEEPADEPPLRKYFPETLLWTPELVTNERGEAGASFQLADTLTTWRMEALGATSDGRLAQSTVDFTAFQPFYIDLDPPPFLTVGDEFGLAPVIRNFTQHDRSVDVETSVGTALALAGSNQPNLAQRKVDALASRSALTSVRVRAVKAAEAADIRVSAKAGDAADAIQKSIRVQPNGQKVSDSDSLIWPDEAEFAFQLPSDTIDGSARVRLVFYPGLLAEAVEAVDALRSAPAGCTEQTISLGLANLKILRLLKANGKTADPAYLQALGLVGETAGNLAVLQRPEGGYAYWSRGPASRALTAYALNFMREASEFLEVDQAAYDGHVNWLLSQQSRQGEWGPPLETLSTALFLLDGTPRTQKAASRALWSVKPLIAKLSDPLVLTTYSLLAARLGEVELVPGCIDKLQENATRKPDGSIHWTPLWGTTFYGWGRAGQIETTALALSALNASRPLLAEAWSPQWDRLAIGAAAFLAQSKDPGGGWYTTRAAAAALEALFELAGEALPDSAESPVEILVNGQKVADLVIPAQSVNPIRFELTRWVDSDTRSIRVRRRSGELRQVVQLASTRHRRWESSDASAEFQAKNGFQFETKFEQTHVNAGEPVTVTVDVQRFQWPSGAPRGMALAQIGLPPGAEVDRASLDRELERVGWSFGRYEVAPDNVTLYLWPSERPIRVAFQFRPRHSFQGVAPSSVLYDYYNPDARVALRPVEFEAR